MTADQEVCGFYLELGPSGDGIAT